jgi:hypothetical protein
MCLRKKLEAEKKNMKKTQIHVNMEEIRISSEE